MMQGRILSPILFSICIDYLIQRLRQSGYGVHIGSLFVGSILYADDIALVSSSCRGLQRMLDICSDFGHDWDIRYNPLKSQLLTKGGDNPPDCQLLLDNKPLQ